MSNVQEVQRLGTQVTCTINKVLLFRMIFQTNIWLAFTCSVRNILRLILYHCLLRVSSFVSSGSYSSVRRYRDPFVDHFRSLLPNAVTVQEMDSANVGTA